MMLKWTKYLLITLAVAFGAVVTSKVTLANDACPKVGFTIVEPQATPDTRAVRVGRNRTIFVRREPLTTTSDIAEIRLAHPKDGDEDDVTIQIKFTDAADQRLHDATTNHSGLRIAFLFDDYVLNNVVWEGPYGIDLGGVGISIPHGMKPARKLMKAIQGCTPTTAAVIRSRP